jgi:hypothetical protein
MSQIGRAQGLYGSLTGNIIDPCGAAVPKAKVDALSVDTGIDKQTETDSRGVYLFDNLQPGLYKVTVTVPSFQTFIETNVVVEASSIRRVDLQLKVASVAQSLEVKADAVALQTDKGDIHNEIMSQEVENLPYNGTEGKNFQALLLLEPGANTTAGTGLFRDRAAFRAAIQIDIGSVVACNHGNNLKITGLLPASGEIGVARKAPGQGCG